VVRVLPLFLLLIAAVAGSTPLQEAYESAPAQGRL
jgi:hypothetical protein